MHKRVIVFWVITDSSNPKTNRENDNENGKKNENVIEIYREWKCSKSLCSGIEKSCEAHTHTHTVSPTHIRRKRKNLPEVL